MIVHETAIHQMTVELVLFHKDTEETIETSIIIEYFTSKQVKNCQKFYRISPYLVLTKTVNPI